MTTAAVAMSLLLNPVLCTQQYELMIQQTPEEATNDIRALQQLMITNKCNDWNRNADDEPCREMKITMQSH